MILSAIAERLKRRSKDDFKGRHFEASLILQAVCWYLRYPLSYRDIEELFFERGLAVTTGLRPRSRLPVWGAGGVSFLPIGPAAEKMLWPKRI